MTAPSNRLLWILVVVGVLAAAGSLVPRVLAERAGRHVDIVVDHNALDDLCQAEGADFPATIKRFKDAGVTSLSYSEQQLPRLIASGRLASYNDADLVRAFRSRRELPPVGVLDATAVTSSTAPLDPSRPTVRPGRLYFVSSDATLLAALEGWMKLLLGKDRVSPWPSPESVRDARPEHPGVLEVASSDKALTTTGLGYFEPDFDLARKARLGVWIRPENRGQFQPAEIESYFAKAVPDPKRPVRGAIFEGLANECMGFPDALDATVESMRRHGLLFGCVEVPTVDAAQKGSRTLGLKMSDRTVRVMSVTAIQQAKLTPEDAIDKFELGVRERNIRVVYVRFFASPEAGKSLIQTNLDYVAALSKALREAGYPANWASPLPTLSPMGILVILVALGVAAATVRAGREIVGLSPVLEWGALACAVALAAGLVLIHKPILWGWALVASLVFPVLSMALVLPRLASIPRDATGMTVVRRSLEWLLWMTGVTMAGSVIVAGVQASTPYMLSVEQFRGIKAVMVGVPMLVVIQYLTRSARDARPLGDVLEKRVVLWHLAAMVVLAGAAAFYIARTGNAAPGAASDTERSMRTLLENLLVVRPRFKEFAFAWPAWTLACLLAWRGRAVGLLWLLVLATAVGQADVIDTFAHIHTPFLISVLRIVNGFWVGAIVSLITAVVALRFLGRGEPEGAPRTD